MLQDKSSLTLLQITPLLIQLQNPVIEANIPQGLWINPQIQLNEIFLLFPKSWRFLDTKMGLSFGNQYGRKSPAWALGGRGGKEGGKAGNSSMDWRNSALRVLMQFWRWGWERKINSVECFDVATKYQGFFTIISEMILLFYCKLSGEKKS